jgi:hypothetical protein
MSNKSGSTNFSVSRGCLLNLLVYAETTSGANGYRVIQSIRVKEVEMWLFMAPGASTAGALDLELEWYSALANDVRISDMGNANEPAYIRSTPPKNTLASFWSVQQSSEGDQLLAISIDNAGYNTQCSLVVDVAVEYTLVDPTTKLLAISTFSGSAHSLNYNVLDNTAIGATSIGSGYLVPQGIESLSPIFAYG